MPSNGRANAAYVIAWHLLVLALLTALPRFLLHVPIWSLAYGEQLPFFVLTGGYAICAIVASAALLMGRPLDTERLFLTVLGVFSLAFIYLMVSKHEASRAILLAVFAAAVVLVPLSVQISRWRAATLGLLALAAVGTFAVSVISQPSRVSAKQGNPTNTSSVVKTAFYNLRQQVYKDYIAEPAVRGGGLANIGDHVLLGTGDGFLYLLDWPDGKDGLSVKKLPYRVPLNGDEFAADTTGKPWHRPLPTDQRSLIGEDAGNEVITWWFRVAGVMVQELGDNVRLYASHYYWKHNQSCWVERVSVLEGPRAQFLSGAPNLTWRTLFETQPCLPIKGEGSRRGTPFAGHFGGGRMILMDPDTILLSVGDFGFNGVSSSRMLSQDPTASYGKAVLIHVHDGHSEIYSSGLRNPQGLYLDPKGGIWETEQGPQGGDELNLLKQGLNYGWPIVTYGTDYGAFKWPLDVQVGEHNGFEAPMYSWLPDIGVSDLVGLQKDLFPVWKGDLMIGALAAQKLFRVRIRNQRVEYVEPIPVQLRIRDVAEASDGKILLWADDDNSIVSLQPAVGSSGEILFATICSGCHKLGDGTSHRIGPDLWGVVGRKIASADGYGDYSAALHNLGGKWSAERISAFITNPQKYAPGTAMEIEGVADADSRAKIIDYIEHAPKVISR